MPRQASLKIAQAQDHRDAPGVALEAWPTWLCPGWYPVALSRDVGTKKIKPCGFAGRDLAVYRTASGRARVVDRYCVHQGTSLVEGDVVGEDLRCAFHHWRFGPDGACVGIPECKKVPPKGRLKTHQVLERHGIIWVQVGSGISPSGPLPAGDLEKSDRWMLVRSRYLGVATTTARDIFENMIDLAHVGPIHHLKDDGEEREFKALPDCYRLDFGSISVEGRQVVTGGHSRVFAPSAWCTTLRGNVKSQMLSRHSGILSHESAWVLAAAPVSPTHTQLFSVIFTRGNAFNPFRHLVGNVVDLAWTYGIYQDMKIWTNKVLRDQPVLAASDGPVSHYRTWWARQEEEARERFGQTVLESGVSANA